MFKDKYLIPINCVYSHKVINKIQFKKSAKKLIDTKLMMGKTYATTNPQQTKQQTKNKTPKTKPVQKKEQPKKSKGKTKKGVQGKKPT
jgi:hypothetical protein